MKENKMSKKYVKYDYVINEMIDDMTKSVSNIVDIISGQEELVACLEKENNPKFVGFIEELKKTTKQYKDQMAIINHRLECANKAKALIEHSKEASFILAMLLEAFGVANKEAKTLEEREANKEEIADFDFAYLA